MPTKPKPPAVMLTKEEYIKRGGGVCPFCQSNNVEGAGVHIDNASASQVVGCNECYAEWVDLYELKGFAVTQQPEKDSV